MMKGLEFILEEMDRTAVLCNNGNAGHQIFIRNKLGGWDFFRRFTVEDAKLMERSADGKDWILRKNPPKLDRPLKTTIQQNFIKHP